MEAWSKYQLALDYKTFCLRGQKIVADDIVFLKKNRFQRQLDLAITVNCDSHEISSLVFSDKQKKQQKH